MPFPRGSRVKIIAHNSGNFGNNDEPDIIEEWLGREGVVTGRRGRNNQWNAVSTPNKVELAVADHQLQLLTSTATNSVTTSNINPEPHSWASETMTMTEYITAHNLGAVSTNEPIRPQEPQTIATIRTLQVGDRVQIVRTSENDEEFHIFAIEGQNLGGLFGTVLTSPRYGPEYNGRSYCRVEVTPTGSWDIPLSILEYRPPISVADRVSRRDLSFHYNADPITEFGFDAWDKKMLPDFLKEKPQANKKVVKVQIIGHEESSKLFGRKLIRKEMFDNKSRFTVIEHTPEFTMKKVESTINCYKLSTPFGPYRFLASEVKILKEPVQQKPKDRKIKKDCNVKFINPRIANSYNATVKNTYKVLNTIMDQNKDPKFPRGHSLAIIELPDQTHRKVWMSNLKRV